MINYMILKVNIKRIKRVSVCTEITNKYLNTDGIFI